MKPLRVLFVLTFWISALIGTTEATEGWRLIKDSGGIKVYEHRLPGTDLMEYIGVAAIDAKIEVIGEVLRDVPSWNRWMADCCRARIEKKYTKNNFIAYMVLKPPVIDERDIILRSNTIYDYNNGKTNISFTCTDGVEIPVGKGRVRVTMMTGYFDMEYLGRNKTKFIYWLKVDPAGSIPKSIAYAVMKNYPYATLKGLKKMVKEQKYSDAARGSEEERQIEKRTNSEIYIQNLLSRRLHGFVKHNDVLEAAIAANKKGIAAIVSAGATYESVARTTTDILLAYASRVVRERDIFEKISNDKKMIDEIADLIISDCGASSVTVDDIIEKYRKKNL